MANLPADRTKLQAAISDQSQSLTPASGKKNREAMLEAYDTIDLLNQKVDGLISSDILLAYPPANYNKLINGNIDVWQRGTTNQILSLNSAYIADRFLVFNNDSGNTIQANRVDITDLSGAAYGLSVRHLGTPTLNGKLTVCYTMESSDARKLAGKTVTVSLKVKALGNINRVEMSARYKTSESSIHSSAVDIVFTGAQVVNSTSFTTIQLTFTVPSLAALTSTGVVGFSIYAFRDGFAQEAANDGFIIAQAQMTTGNLLLPFQARDFAEELLVCQRYYQRRFQNVATGTFYSATSVSLTLPHILPMRLAPTLSRVGSVITVDDIGAGFKTSSSFPSNIVTTEAGSRFDVDGFTGANTFRFARLVDDSIQLDAEL